MACVGCKSVIERDGKDYNCGDCLALRHVVFPMLGVSVLDAEKVNMRGTGSFVIFEIPGTRKVVTVNRGEILP